MRVMINDHAGHPFPVQLSRTLASRGHRVLHTYCSTLLSPRGQLDKRPQDPSCFDVIPIPLTKEFNRYGLVSRWLQEKELGRKLAEVAIRFAPDVILSANTPLRTQYELLCAARTVQAKFIFWLQDILSIGITRALKKKIPILGALIGNFFKRFENKLLQLSDHIILISDDYKEYLPHDGIHRKNVTVIENWAPVDEINAAPKANTWSIGHGLDNKFVFLYSGTLGLKHNPELLFRLALKLKSNPDVAVVVISEGLGADFLASKKSEFGLDNLLLLEFQPYEAMSEILGSGDVLIALLELEAATFAVPSKILTYLCAKRPLLLAVPHENLAARIVSGNNAGIVVSPEDEAGFIDAAMGLMRDDTLRRVFADNGFSYAHNFFCIDRITDRFESIMGRQQ